jgi:prepilin-type N-terminal cleavage/methylation domain-containing protein
MGIRGTMKTNMKIPARFQCKPRRRGFSVIELMVVITIVTIVLASILTQLEQVQQRATAEQGKIDEFQQTRDFFDQVYNDTRQIGYPNVRNFDTTGWALPLANHKRVAIGLVKLTSTQMVFEGDLDGTGSVSEVSYALNGSGTCPGCLQRAQVAKVAADPVTGQSAFVYNTEVQNVTNATIFKAYDGSGTDISASLPLDADTNPTVIPTVRTIEISVQVANPQSIDPKTGQKLEADFKGRVQITNCSMATTGLKSASGIQLTCQ